MKKKERPKTKKKDNKRVISKEEIYKQERENNHKTENDVKE